MTRIEAIGAGLSGVAMVFFFAMLLITPGFWFDLRSLTIQDAAKGQAVRLEYDREFYRDFNGGWNVAIWVMDRGEWTAYCHADGAWPYRKATPDPSRDLAWLVDGDARCSALPPGTYQVEVTVTANPDTIIARSQTIISNPFEVRP